MVFLDLPIKMIEGYVRSPVGNNLLPLRNAFTMLEAVGGMLTVIQQPHTALGTDEVTSVGIKGFHY